MPAAPRTPGLKTASPQAAAHAITTHTTDGTRPAPPAPDMFDPLCPSSALPLQIGDKWTGMIVICLEGGPRRFNELRVPLAGIAPKVLAETLRAMMRDGLVTRTACDENPPRVEYALTPLGRSLLTLVDAARAWSREHLDELLSARARNTPLA